MNNRERFTEEIRCGECVLGIEFGSTRMKAVLTDRKNRPIAEGSFGWENRLENGVWTYHLEDVWEGLAACYRDLKQTVEKTYGVVPERFAAIGFSAMMHGYLAFNEAGELLVPFRTWRNTMTQEASAVLTETFSFHIPQRWSIAHLYQAILNGEAHVSDIRFLTTLAGYAHWKLTGRRVIGIGDAAGMFPIDTAAKDYDERMLEQFDALVREKGYPWKLREILPVVLCAGEDAGALTPEGALLLDPAGDLESGIPLCPPEGDAGTGMAATNSVAVRTGNVSAGTSIFAMAVLESDLRGTYEEIDLVTTPSGEPVAMVHCNNCTSDLNAWVSLFSEVLGLFGASVDTGILFEGLFKKSLEGDADCGGLLSYNYVSGESVTGFDLGRPLFVRRPEDTFHLANFMRTQIYSAYAALADGMEILTKREGVAIDRMYGHGGLFKTAGVAQRYLAAALGTPVTVMETASEGGAWGIALLASYRVYGNKEETLADFLAKEVFAGEKELTLVPDAEDTAGFAAFLARYNAALPVERAAVETV